MWRNEKCSRGWSTVAVFLYGTPALGFRAVRIGNRTRGRAPVVAFAAEHAEADLVRYLADVAAMGWAWGANPYIRYTCYGREWGDGRRWDKK